MTRPETALTPPALAEIPKRSLFWPSPNEANETITASTAAERITNVELFISSSPEPRKEIWGKCCHYTRRGRLVQRFRRPRRHHRIGSDFVAAWVGLT